MSGLIWLLLMAACGWTAGRSVGGKGLGVVADLLLGITGALGVRFFRDALGFTGPRLDAIFFFCSVCGAAALPGFVRYLMKRQHHARGPASAPKPRDPLLAEAPMARRPVSLTDTDASRVTGGQQKIA